MEEQRAIEGTKVKLGTKEFYLLYPLGVMRQAKEKFGGSITDWDNVVSKLDETQIGELIHFGTRTLQPDLTLEQIEALVDPTQFKQIIYQFWVAIGRSLPPKNASSPVELLPQIQEVKTRAETILLQLQEMEKSITSGSGVSPDTTSVSATASSGG